MQNWLILVTIVSMLLCRCAPTVAQPYAPTGAPFAAPTAAPSIPPAPKELPPIYTRQSVFAIPFKIDTPRSSSQRPVGVQLHVSEDGGNNWRLYEQVDPAASKFTFQAPHDGDYQFFVRTLDAAGRLQPATPPAGELRVIVDTLAPRLELQATQSSTGEVLVNWRMLDRHLRPESFRLEYQSRGETSWNPVAVPAPMAEQRVDSGEITFWPGAEANEIVVRAQVIDEAGNPAIAQQPLAAEREGTRTPALPAASRKGNSEQDPPADSRGWQSIDDQSNPGSVRWQPDESAQYPLVRQTRPPAEEVGPPAAAEPIGPGERLPDLTGTPSRSGPFENTSTGPSRLPPIAAPSRSEPPPASYYEELPPAAKTRPAETVVDTGPTTSPWAAGKSPPPTTGPDMTVDALKQAFSNEPKINAPVKPDKPQPGAASAKLNLDQLPPGEQPLMVNSRRFEFDYEVESASTIGISKVEVWGTRDGGRTWSSFGVDEDKRSPVSVAVDGEGLYGFRLVVHAARGLESAPPGPGDEPDIWVGVDRTQPTVQLLEATAQAGEGLGALQIRWQAEDEMLADTPISIYYSHSPAGEWTSIAEGIDNDGEYLWNIDQQVPERIYVRVEARDAAGNVATAETSDPVSLAKLRPQGRIREVRPSKDARRNTTWNIVR